MLPRGKKLTQPVYKLQTNEKHIQLFFLQQDDFSAWQDPLNTTNRIKMNKTPQRSAARPHKEKSNSRTTILEMSVVKSWCLRSTDRMANRVNPGFEVIEHVYAQVGWANKNVWLINLKLLTMANSFLLNTAEHENIHANKYETANCCRHFHIY